MSDPEASALAVYWRFFEGTNSRDSRRVTDTLNYPHVRISARGNPNIVRHRETHTGRMSFDPLISTGWDHTVGMEPEVLHVAQRKVHLKGGWTRYDRDGRPIMSNMVTYIATLADGRWGLQSRFGTDTDLFWGKPEDRPDAVEVDLENNARKAENIVSSALDLLGIDNPGAAGRCHYPLLVIHPGDVESIGDSEALQQRLSTSRPLVSDVEAIQVGATGVNVSFRATVDARRVEGVFLVKVDDARWGIKGGSLITS
ncbi:MAG: hypothetical protein OXI90_07570 [Gammaproteobacteria bacterium]|nr:hypothetical protein [Gammaproteobacteria bacterium]